MDSFHPFQAIVRMAFIFVFSFQAAHAEWFFPVPGDESHQEVEHMDRVYRKGVLYGRSDKLKGATNQASRHWHTIAITDRLRFSNGYMAGYNQMQLPNNDHMHHMGMTYGISDKRKGLTNQASRHWHLIDAHDRVTFSQGYQEGYSRGQGTGNNKRAYGLGISYGLSDKRDGLTNQASRYWHLIDAADRTSFSQGYQAGYDKGHGGANNKHSYNLGVSYGMSDKRERLTNQASRYWHLISAADRATFSQGYQAGYDKGHAGGGYNHAYGLGMSYGIADKREGLNNQASRYWHIIDAADRLSFSQGYQSGYDQGGAHGGNHREMKIFLSSGQITIMKGRNVVRTFYTKGTAIERADWHEGQKYVVTKSRTRLGEAWIQLFDIQTGLQAGIIKASEVRRGNPPWAVGMGL